MWGNLPEFERPPVVEVAVSVQFDAPVLDGPMLMLWWTRVRNRFPKYEQAPPLPSTIETFDGLQRPQFEFQISNMPSTPRLLMISGSDTEVLQAQEDRLGYSWRKLHAGDEYPRYTKIRENFVSELDEFRAFISDEGLPPLSPVQCEVTYVDLILPRGVWETHADLGNIIPSVDIRPDKEFLPPPEECRFATQYVISDGEGVHKSRMYVSIEPGFLPEDRSPMYLMKFTVRGAPKEDSTAGILDTMDLGHEWAVRAFTSLTSDEMHRVWGRTL